MKQVIERRSMRWSSDVPEQAGHYWLRNYVFKGMEHFRVNVEPIVVRITGETGRLEIEDSYFKENDLPRSVSDVIQGEWSGPILLPRD